MGYPDLVVVQNMAFPKLGLPIAVVEDFIQTCGGEAAFLNANGSHVMTVDALRAFILPETATTKLSFCEELRFTDARVRDATVLISHGWRFSFVEFFKASKKHLHNSGASRSVSNSPTPYDSRCACVVCGVVLRRLCDGDRPQLRHLWCDPPLPPTYSASRFFWPCDLLSRG